eukprot:TRINITY_DN76943_c0_g1_i1.p1 TRINITY_DN76943_c0_g1~~TRINITY_DN76943_c0_g1_i1.p1  ORF type:complete len:551 (+),score=31.67 TRINITY_DN76943_c0_g1_i1:28-1653(+)
MTVGHLSLYLLACLAVICRSSQSTVQYRAAAVQHTPYVGTSYFETLHLNYNAYSNYAQEAKESGTQVIVFPEEGVGWKTATNREEVAHFCYPFPKVFNGKPLLIACNNASSSPTSSLGLYNQELRGSCIAQQHSIIMVINTCSRVPCNNATDPHCPDDGHFFFNTDVVFDERGALVAQYHKSHLFANGNMLDQPYQPDPVWFDSSFGVRFGVMICWDIGFVQPADYLLNTMNITDFLYSVSWINWNPLQSGPLFQRGFSWVKGVNIVASNFGTTPHKGGGGIFSAGKVEAEWWQLQNDDHVHKIVFANLTTPPPLAAPSKEETALPLSLTRPHVKQQGALVGHPTATSTSCVFGPWPPGTPVEGACILFSPTKLPKSVPIHMQLTTTKNFHCDLQFTLAAGPVGNVESGLYVFAAINFTFFFPGTPSPTGQQICGLIPCIGGMKDSMGRTVCQWITNTTQQIVQSVSSTYFSSVALTGKGYQTPVRIPMAAADGHVLVPLKYLKYQGSADTMTLTMTNAPPEGIPISTFTTFSVIHDFFKS